MIKYVDLQYVVSCYDEKRKRVLPEESPFLTTDTIDCFFNQTILMDTIPQTIGYDTGQSIEKEGEIDLQKFRNSTFYFEETMYEIDKINRLTIDDSINYLRRDKGNEHRNDDVLKMKIVNHQYYHHYKQLKTFSNQIIMQLLYVDLMKQGVACAEPYTYWSNLHVGECVNGVDIMDEEDESSSDLIVIDASGSEDHKNAEIYLAEYRVCMQCVHVIKLLVAIFETNRFQISKYSPDSFFALEYYKEFKIELGANAGNIIVGIELAIKSFSMLRFRDETFSSAIHELFDVVIDLCRDDFIKDYYKLLKLSFNVMVFPKLCKTAARAWNDVKKLAIKINQCDRDDVGPHIGDAFITNIVEQSDLLQKTAEIFINYYSSNESGDLKEKVVALEAKYNTCNKYNDDACILFFQPLKRTSLAAWLHKRVDLVAKKWVADGRSHPFIMRRVEMVYHACTF